MGILDRLFGGKKKEEEEKIFEQAAEDAECPHTALVAEWETAEEMGHEDKISGYRCEGCGAHFSREEGEKIKESQDSLKGLQT